MELRWKKTLLRANKSSYYVIYFMQLKARLINTMKFAQKMIVYIDDTGQLKPFRNAWWEKDQITVYWYQYLNHL